MKTLIAMLLFTSAAWSAEVSLLPEIKTTDGKVYRSVRIMSSTPAVLKIMHADGMAAVPLQVLPPELQARYPYDAAKAAQHSQAAETALAERKLVEKVSASGVTMKLTVTQVLGSDALCSRYLDYNDLDVVGGDDAHSAFFVEDLGEGFVNDAIWQGVLYPMGRLQYTTVLKSVATVRRYTTKPEKAVQWIRAGSADRTINSMKELGLAQPVPVADESNKSHHDYGWHGPIPGANPVNTYLGLEQKGFELKRNMGSTLSEWTCTQKDGQMDLRCTLLSKPGELQSLYAITATIQDGNAVPNVVEAAGFLGWVASLPYDGAEPETAKQWVSDQVLTGENSSQLIGGVKFELYLQPRSRMLRIGKAP